METEHTASVNRARLLQFLYYFGSGMALPFFSLYFKHKLLTPEGTPATYLIGILFFIQSIMLLFSAPVAGILGDMLSIHNRLISLFAFVSAASAVFIVIPGLPGFSGLSLSAAFVLILIGMGVMGLFNKPIVPLIDTETLHALHAAHGESSGYGTVRLFGSIGWTLSATLLGVLLWLTDSLVLSPLGFAAGFLLLGFVTRRDVTPPQRAEKLPLEHLKRDAAFRKFLIFVFFTAFSVFGSYQFTSYYMDDAHVPYLFIGLSLGLSAIPEIPILMNSAATSRKIGNSGMIITGGLVMVLKLVFFSLLGDTSGPLVFILVQALHGVGWAFLIAGMVRFTDDLAHPRLRGTYQNLFQIPMTLGGAVSGLFTAWIIQTLGSSWMMGIHGLILLTAALYFFFFVREIKPSRDG